MKKSAAFGRLCVETHLKAICGGEFFSAAFGRLCVETFSLLQKRTIFKISRLRAAVC